MQPSSTRINQRGKRRSLCAGGTSPKTGAHSFIFRLKPLSFSDFCEASGCGAQSQKKPKQLRNESNMSLGISASSFSWCTGWHLNTTGAGISPRTEKSGSGGDCGSTNSSATRLDSPDCAALERITAKVTRTQTGNFIFGAQREEACLSGYLP